MSTSEDLSTNIKIEDILSLAPRIPYERIPTLQLFLAKYRSFPCKFECAKATDDVLFHIPSILNYIHDELKHDINKDCIERRYDEQTKQKFISCQVCDLGNGFVISWHNSYFESNIQNPNNMKTDYDDKYFHVVNAVTFYYLREHDEFAQQLSNKFSQMTILESKSCSLQMICKRDCGYYLTGIKIKKPLITDMGLHYGQNFVPIHNKIISSLNEKESHGIVLLHGIPGSGKTHYIRYLIQEIKDKTLIYVPPDMAKEISSPAFLPFLMQYENAVLIIEDAENIIKDRNDMTTPSQAVANLLNLSDGLLGDVMHQQIIATFNCDLASIDPALLRKGRLIANYEFNKLDIESAKTLSDKIGFGRESVVEPMTLAEIYNQGDQINKE